MNCEAEMAMMPERKVDAALNARSACPIFPCWMGLVLPLPGFVRLSPALSSWFATDAAREDRTDVVFDEATKDVAFVGAEEVFADVALVTISLARSSRRPCNSQYHHTRRKVFKMVSLHATYSPATAFATPTWSIFPFFSKTRI